MKRNNPRAYHPFWFAASWWRLFLTGILPKCWEFKQNWQCSSQPCYVHAKSFQSCATLCDLMDCSPPGSSVHGTLQARILEWLPCPPPGDLLDPGIKPASLMCPALAGRFSTSSTPWEGPHKHKPSLFTSIVGKNPALTSQSLRITDGEKHL